MPDEITTDIQHEHMLTIIKLIGDVTTFSETRINEAYLAALQNNAKHILIDFKNVNYINSAGIAILIGLVTENKKKEIKLYICGVSPHFQKIFKMVGLTQHTIVYENENAALSSIKKQ